MESRCLHAEDQIVRDPEEECAITAILPPNVRHVISADDAGSVLQCEDALAVVHDAVPPATCNSLKTGNEGFADEMVVYSRFNYACQVEDRVANATSRFATGLRDEHLSSEVPVTARDALARALFPPAETHE